MEKLVQTREECLQSLKDLEIGYKVYEHEAVFNMEEMSAKAKLERSPYIKNLFYFSKKKNNYYMVLAEMNTKVEKGNSSLMQLFGKNWTLAIIMSGWQRRNKLKKF